MELGSKSSADDGDGWGVACTVTERRLQRHRGQRECCVCGPANSSKESTADSAVWFAGTNGTRCAELVGPHRRWPPLLDSNSYSSPISHGGGSSTRTSQTDNRVAPKRPLAAATLPAPRRNPSPPPAWPVPAVHLRVNWCRQMAMCPPRWTPPTSARPTSNQP